MSPILEKALQSARIKSVPAGQILMYAEDEPQDVYIIKSGIIKLYDIDDQGNEKILHLVGQPSAVPFSFFSELDKPLKWFYGTVTDCELYTISHDDLTKLISDDYRVLQLLTHTFSDSVHELLVRLSSLGKTNSHDKVVAAIEFFLSCHAVDKGKGWWSVTFPVTHQLIADLCGITRESTAIVMKELSDKGVIDCKRVSLLDINKSKLLG